MKIESSNINLRFDSIKKMNIEYYKNRLTDHKKFVKEYKKEMKYFNNNINCGVMTRQEKEIKFYQVDSIYIEQGEQIVNYLEYNINDI